MIPKKRGAISGALARRIATARSQPNNPHRSPDVLDPQQRYNMEHRGKSYLKVRIVMSISRSTAHRPRRIRTALVRCTLLSALIGLLGGCVVEPLTPTTSQTQPTATAPQASAAPSAPPSPTTPSAELSVQPAAPAEPNAAADDSGLTLITGEFRYSNDIITTYYVEQSVALTDMYGFVTRDLEWEIPIEGQTLGFLELDGESMRGNYTLQLPAQPRGTPVDVDHDGQADAGVQIFAVSYSPNLTGGPYSEGDDRSTGWPSYLASTVNDPENKDEVTGGKLVVWAPDGEQQFPSGFGPDNLLFTADDPVAAIPAGYSIIDLDQEPFGISQEDEPELTLHEPDDAGVKDYADLSYTEAFTQMFEQVRKEYAFNGIPEKQPNWDELAAQLTPRVEEAQRQRDPEAFYLALRDFTNAFRDGHVGLSAPQFDGQIFQEVAIGGYGFAIRELDDKRVIVNYVLPDGPAAEAGMTVGAEIIRFNDKPIAQAISEVDPLGGPFSTDFARRYQQQIFLVRAPLDAEAQVTFVNRNQAEQTATLRASDERETYFVNSLYNNYDPDALPVEFRTLDSGVGYVRVNSNYDDLNLIVRLFERALRTFENNGVPGLIIDMRLNSGGAPLGLAGFLTDEDIPLAQLEYFSEKTGAFEPEGVPDVLRPNAVQYRFDRMALLVEQTCASACEIEAYGFSQVPEMIVIGQYPTAGVEAEVARGQFRLPEDISLQIPTGRFVLPDGSIFLEGTGVQPTQRVPIDEQTVLSDEDVILQAAEEAILGQ